MLARYQPKVVAVTGSVGKTSTKDALFAVIESEFRSRRSEKSFNGEIGVPLTILGLPNGWNNPFVWLSNIFNGFILCFFPKILQTKAIGFPEWLVLEIGADHPGDIENITKWLHPDAVVVTRMSEVPVHVEFFKSPEEVIKEKTFLVQALRDSGTLFLNADDKDVMSMRDAKRNTLLFTFGIEEPADFQSSNLEVTYEKLNGDNAPSGITFKVNYNGNSVPINVLGRFGRQHIYPALAALAFGQSLGLNTVSMADSLANYLPSPGRMRIIPGVKNTTIIDDSYNSSPVAVREALRTLGEIKTIGRKIAVLGDMLELGKYSVEEHKKAGKEVIGVAEILVTVGLRARDIAMGGLNNGMNERNIFQFDDSLGAGKYIEMMLEEGDIVLVKGSQGARMEKIVEEIMAEPDRASELLARQDPEWKNR